MMDAVKYITEKERMCKAQGLPVRDRRCDGCPLLRAANARNQLLCIDLIKGYPEIAVGVVEKWSREHPIKTNKEKFFEDFGIDADFDITDKWWGEEYKEPKKEER